LLTDSIEGNSPTVIARSHASSTLASSSIDNPAVTPDE